MWSTLPESLFYTHTHTHTHTQIYTHTHTHLQTSQNTQACTRIRGKGKKNRDFKRVSVCILKRLNHNILSFSFFKFILNYVLSILSEANNRLINPASSPFHYYYYIFVRFLLKILILVWNFRKVSLLFSFFQHGTFIVFTSIL